MMASRAPGVRVPPKACLVAVGPCGWPHAPAPQQPLLEQSQLRGKREGWGLPVQVWK